MTSAFRIASLLMLLLLAALGVARAQPLPAGAKARLSAADGEEPLFGVYLVAFSPDGKLLATRSRDQVVRVWDVTTAEKKLELAAHEDRVLSVAFSPDGKSLATASPGANEAIRIWDTGTGQKIRELKPGGSVVRYLPDGKTLAVARPDQVAFYAGDKPEPQRVVALEAPRPVVPLDLSADGNTLVCYYASVAGRRSDMKWWICLFDLKKDQRRELVQLDAVPVAARLSPSGHRLAIASRRQDTVRLFDLSGGGKPVVLEAHDEPVQSVAFSPGGHFLATASWDTTVRVWEVLTNKRLTTLAGHEDHVCAVGFSSRGHWLGSGASGLRDNSALVWDVRQKILGEQRPAELSEELLRNHWELLSDESAEAFHAVGALVASPAASLPFLEKRVAELTLPSDVEQISAWIRELDDDSFQVRENAQKELLRVRVLAEAQLRKTYKTTTSFEVKSRVKRILDAPVSEEPLEEPQRRRMYRLIYALELIGNDQAKKQLAKLAGGFPNSDIIQQAMSAGERVARAGTPKP